MKYRLLYLGILGVMTCAQAQIYLLPVSNSTQDEADSDIIEPTDDDIDNDFDDIDDRFEEKIQTIQNQIEYMITLYQQYYGPITPEDKEQAKATIEALIESLPPEEKEQIHELVEAQIQARIKTQIETRTPVLTPEQKEQIQAWVDSLSPEQKAQIQAQVEAWINNNNNLSSKQRAEARDLFKVHKPIRPTPKEPHPTQVQKVPQNTHNKAQKQAPKVMLPNNS